MGLRDTLRLVGAVSSEEFIPEAKPYNTQRPVLGAAQRIDLKKPNTVVSTEEQAFTVWQREAWEYYDAIGEVKYAFQLVGAVMSRLRIAAASTRAESVPLAFAAASAAFSAISSAPVMKARR